MRNKDAFTDKNLKMPKTSDPDITITQKLKDRCLYGVNTLQCLKILTASLEVKLVNITLCKCSWYILSILSDLAYGVRKGFLRVEKMFQV